MWFSQNASGHTYKTTWLDENQTHRSVISYGYNLGPGIHFYNYPLLPDTQIGKHTVSPQSKQVAIASYSQQGELSIEPLLSSNYEDHYDWSHPTIAKGNGVLYFVWHSPIDTLPSSFQFYGQDVNFKDQKDSTFHLQIIKTDLRLNILASKRYQWHNESRHRFYIEAVEVDGNDRLQMSFRRHPILGWHDSIRIDSFWLRHRSNQYQRNILRITPDLAVDTLVMFERFFSTDGTNKRIYASSFSFGLNVSPVEKKGTYDYVYQISYLNDDLSVNNIGTLETNLISTFTGLHTKSLDFDGKIYFFGIVPDDVNSAVLGNKVYPIDTNNPLTGILFSVDSLGVVNELSKTYQNLLYSSLAATETHFWLKILSADSFSLDDSTFSRPAPHHNGKLSRTHYIAYDKSGRKKRLLEGPGGSWLSTRSSLIVKDNLIYDNNGYHNEFVLDSIPYGKQGATPVAVNLMHTQLRFFDPPKERPHFQIEQVSCNRVKVSHTRTDAEHYTLLVSTDTIRKWPRDGANYSFSYDYLKAHPIGNKVKVLHQGYDTAFFVSNLVAGRRYFFAMIPGNGPAGNTVYNRDSIDTLSLYIPPSIWQDSLLVSPSRDTAVCAYDSLLIKGLSPFPIRWMDRKTDTVRKLAENGDFYFTCKDRGDCVLSSDTVALGFYKVPIISSLSAISPMPYCEGDTVDIKAVSDGSYLWEDGSTNTTYRVTKTGKYLLQSYGAVGCKTSKEIDITFHDFPRFRFSVDSVVGYNGSVQVPYITNADSLSWHYSDSAFTQAPIVAEGDYLLKVYAYSAEGCFVNDSIQVRNYDVMESIFPNAFTPNNDGLNDVWYFIHPDTVGTLTIFDRWGAVVFHGNNYWDGKKLGQVLPTGAYEYVFRFNENDVSERIEGTVNLLR